MLRDFTREKFDVIIQAGQSNSEGAGLGSVERPYHAGWDTRPQVLYFNGDFTLSMAAERVFDNSPMGDFSLSFARKYLEENRLLEDRKLLILRGAVGGTGFSDGRWGEGNDLDTRLMEMIRTAAALNPENRFLCFLWHQGETDVLAGGSAEAYRQKLLSLVERVRREAGDGALPFVTADFVPLWKSRTEGAAEFSEAVRRVCAGAGNAAFVESRGLLSNEEAGFPGDDIHFCRQSLYQLGERMYGAYTCLAAGVQPRA